jgi:NAD(P)-dependent dehydrogenase (short-subunit alcohol dehydrogenase family)
MTHDFSGQVAVITGGASGIGRALGAALTAAGAQVLLADRTAGDDLVACDVSRLDDLEALAELAWQRFGRVDLLFNNAGVGGGGGRLWKADLDEVRRLFDINFWGVWHGCRAFAPRMVAQDHPSAIYNTASENALFCAVPRAGAYIASKHAVLGLTESLREDLPPHVHAGTIIPGWVASGLTAQNADHAMPAERFAEIVLPQVAARERFVVSHACNVDPFGERTAAIENAYARNAPRYPGDEEYDVRSFIAKRTES